MREYFRELGLGFMTIAVIVTIMTGPAAAQVPLQTGLVANWTFDDGSGTTVTDTQGGANGALNSGTWTSGLLGPGTLNALNLSGAADGVLLGNPTSLDLGTSSACTFSTWINLDYLPSAQAVSYAGILDSAQDNYVLYADRTAKEIRFKVTTTTGPTSTANFKQGLPEYKLSTGTWHHVVGTYDGTYVKVYLDGELAGMGSFATSGNTIRPNTSDLGLGYQPGSVSTSHFDGSIDETAVWNRALSADEISYLYNGGSGVAVMAANPTILPSAPPTPDPLPNPVIHYEFENNLTNTGSTAGSYDGVLSTATDGSTSTYETAKGGKGLRLDNLGLNHKTGGTYVSIPGYTLPDEGTISLWYIENGDPFSYPSIFDNSVNGAYWEMWLSSGDRMAWRVSTQQAQANYAPVDEWHHYAATWEKDSSGSGKATFSVYVDGVLEATNIDTWVNPGTFFLGGGNDDNMYAVGTYDDFRIYDKALAPEQIALLAQQVPEPGILFLLVSGLVVPVLRRK